MHWYWYTSRNHACNQLLTYGASHQDGIIGRMLAGRHPWLLAGACWQAPRADILYGTCLSCIRRDHREESSTCHLQLHIKQRNYHWKNCLESTELHYDHADPLEAKDMYYVVKVSENKVKYISVPGSSKLEGFQEYANMVLSCGHTGAKLAAALLSYFLGRWNIDRGVANRGQSDYGMYDHRSVVLRLLLQCCIVGALRCS